MQLHSSSSDAMRLVIGNAHGDGCAERNGSDDMDQEGASSGPLECAGFVRGSVTSYAAIGILAMLCPQHHVRHHFTIRHPPCIDDSTANRASSLMDHTFWKEPSSSDVPLIGGRPDARCYSMHTGGRTPGVRLRDVVNRR
jgi:hypothetical protein